MEISRNKAILMFIAWILAFLILVMFIIMMTTNKNRGSWNSGSSAEDFIVWTVWDDLKNQTFLDDFKTFAKTNTNIRIENFDNYDDYSLALTYAITSWSAPDIFVLNNNEKNSIFENQTIGINPKVLSVDEFRDKYQVFMADQLIQNWKDGDFLRWLPVWFETLWVFYNRTFVRSTDLSDLSSLRNTISKLKEKNPDIIPIAIWNGTTVEDSVDIATQFMLAEWAEKWISSLSEKSIKSWLSNYYDFWDINSSNGYNSRKQNMIQSNQKAIDLFSNADTFMVVWYPRLINEIAKKWFKSSLLLATTFPSDAKNGATLVNYNYFVINKDSKKIDLADKFIAYLSSNKWLEKYFEAFPYYLPAKMELDENLQNQKIHPDFNIKIWSFYNDSLSYTSFDKWIKTIYDEALKKVLDTDDSVSSDFLKIKKILTCQVWKIFSQTNFSEKCDK